MNFESKFDPYGAVSTPLYQTATFKQVKIRANLFLLCWMCLFFVTLNDHLVPSICVFSISRCSILYYSFMIIYVSWCSLLQQKMVPMTIPEVEILLEMLQKGLTWLVGLCFVLQLWIIHLCFDDLFMFCILSILAKLDKADRAFCFTSGMAALTAVVHLLKNGAFSLLTPDLSLLD